MTKRKKISKTKLLREWKTLTSDAWITIHDFADWEACVRAGRAPNTTIAYFVGELVMRSTAPIPKIRAFGRMCWAYQDQFDEEDPPF